MGKKTNVALVVVLALFIGSVSRGAYLQAQVAQTTTLRLESAQLKAGGKADVHLILESAPSGLHRLSVTVTVKDPQVVLIRAAEPGAVQEIFRVGFGSTTTLVYLEIVDAYDLVGIGAKNISLAVFRIEGLHPGKTEISIDVKYFEDDRGRRDAPVTQAGVITVVDPSQPLPSPPQPPTPPSPPLPTPPGPSASSFLYLESKPLVIGTSGVVSLILSSVPTGLQMVQIKLTIPNPQVAQFTEITSPTVDSRFLGVLSQTPASLEFRLVDFRDQVSAGMVKVLLASIGVRGVSKGKVALGVQISAFVDDAGNTLALPVQPSEIQVLESLLAPLPGARGPAQDLDDDGLYEDVNGDGKLTYDDPVMLAFESQNPIVQEHKGFFDFNHDGKVDFADAVALAALVASR